MDRHVLLRQFHLQRAALLLRFVQSTPLVAQGFFAASNLIHLGFFASSQIRQTRVDLFAFVLQGLYLRLRLRNFAHVLFATRDERFGLPAQMLEQLSKFVQPLFQRLLLLTE